MHRRLILIVSVVIAGLLLTAASAQESQPMTIPPTDYATVEAMLASNSPTRVIIGLDVNAYQPEGQLNTRLNTQNQRARISTAQSQLLNTLGVAETTVAATVFETIPFMALTVDANQLSALQANPLVTSITPSGRVYPTLQESIPLIGADVTAANGLTGAGYAVAVLDTGVDAAHPFFEGRVTHEACFSSDEFPYVTNCPNGTTEQYGPGAARACEGRDGCFHGTHVAGIAAGNSEARQLRGVATQADIIGVQVFSGINSSYCIIDPFACNAVTSSFDDVVRGLEYVYTLANDQNVPVVAANLSLGTAQRFEGVCVGVDPALDAIVKNLRDIDVATIVATGNSSFTDGIAWPACSPGVVSVGASDDTDTVAEFSNGASIVDLLAPGVEIGSAVPPGTNPDDESVIYGITSGTSMAAPHVLGAWAVLQQADPNASLDDILIALQTTGVSITDHRNGLVFPRIQVDAAVTALQNGLPPRYPLLLNEIQLADNQAIEIYNAGPTTAQLAGWAVELYSGATVEHVYTFPANTTLNSGQYLTLLRGTGTDTASSLYMGAFNSTWGTAQSGAVLLRNSIAGVDFVRWGEAAVQPLVGTKWAGNDPSVPEAGFTLGRDRDHTDTDSGYDWFDTAPTIGTQNNTDRPPSRDPDDFEGARVVDVIPYNDTMSTAQATAVATDPDPPCYQPPVLTGDRVNRSVWYRYTATEDRDLTFSTAGTDYATIMSIWTGELGNLSLVACHDDVVGFPSYSNVTSIISMRVQAGTTYHIMISAGALLGQSGSSLKFSVTDAVTAVLANDNFDTPEIIRDLDYAVAMNITGSTAAGDDPAPPCYQAVFGNRINNTVWFQYTAPRDQQLVWDTFGSGYGAIMSIWTGERGNLQSVACHSSGWDVSDDASSPNAKIDLAAQGGTTYHVMISAGGFLGIAQGDLVLTVTDNSPPNQPPSVTGLPTQQFAEADTVNLQVVASDPNNDVLTYIADDLPLGLEMNPTTGVISGVVSYNAAGNYNSTIEVVDRGQLSSSTGVTWIISNTNRTPLLEPIVDQAHAEATAVSVQAIASDPDYDTLTYAASNLPDGVSINAQTGLISGLLTYTSAGVHAVTVTVTDNGTPTPEQTSIGFQWTVEDNDPDNNTPPVAVADAYSVSAGKPLVVLAPGLLENDIDLDEDELTAELVADVTQGTLQFTGDGAFTYTPDAEFIGEDSFTYTVNDGTATSAAATVTITVMAPAERVYPADGQTINASTYDGPNFTFRHIDGVDWYRVWIGKFSNGSYYDQALFRWFDASVICDVNDLCTIPDDLWLTNSDYAWWITTWTDGQSEPIGANWNRSLFTVAFDVPPNSVTMTDPTNGATVSTAPSTLTWSHDPDVHWYRVWFGPVDYSQGAVAFQWVNATNPEICNATTCTLDVDERKIGTGEYHVYFQVWGPNGFYKWGGVNGGQPSVFFVGQD